MTSICRLVEDSSKDRISLRTLLKDLKRLPPNPSCARNDVLAATARRTTIRFCGKPVSWRTPGPREGGAQRRPQDDTLSEALHIQFDKLIGIDDPTKRSREDWASHYLVYSNLSAAFAHAGKMDEAKAALAEARRLNPAITVKWMKEHTPNLPAVSDGLRKAGLPEE